MPRSTKVALALAVSLAPLPALARDFAPSMIDTNGTRAVIASDSIIRKNGRVDAMVAFQPRNGGARWLTFVRMDCKADRMFAVRIDGVGSYYYRVEDHEYRPIQPGSVGGWVASTLCPPNPALSDIGLDSVGDPYALPAAPTPNEIR